MRVYNELKKIACMNQKIEMLSNKLAQKIGLDDIDLSSARLVSGLSERFGHLYRNGVMIDNSGLVNDDYYCCQHTGYIEDEFFGKLYFKTNVPGQFVEIDFHTY